MNYFQLQSIGKEWIPGLLPYPVLKVVRERSPISPAIRGRVPPPQNFYIYFWSENGEFWCIIAFFIGGILCDLELQESKQETRYRRGKSKGAGSPTLATQPHFKPWPHRTVPYTYSELQNTENFNSITVT